MSARLPLADITFIRDFATFCRAKPADEAYEWIDVDRCALAQFGYPGAQCTDFEDNLADLGVPRDAFFAAIGSQSTFGALADRLDSLLVDAPAVSAQP